MIARGIAFERSRRHSSVYRAWKARLSPCHPLLKKSGGGKGKQNNGGAAAEDAYAGKVRAKVARSVKTPKGKFESGEARIIVLIGANGQLLKTTMSRSSGDQKVDDAAAAAVKRAAPFPPIPEALGQSSVSVTLPIHIDS